MFEKKICNCCGKTLDSCDMEQDFTIHKRIGYGSIYDGYLVDFQICSECFDKMVEQCAVSPIARSKGVLI